MPALTFRKKLVLAFLLVTIGAVGAALLIVAQQFQSNLDERMSDETERVQKTYSQAQHVQVELLAWGCRTIAEQPRFRAILESREWDVGNLTYFASQFYEKSGIDFWSIYDVESKACVFRAFEGLAQSGTEAPEADLAKQAISRLEARIASYQAAAGGPQAARAEAELKSTSAASGYLLESGRLYQIVALPVQSADDELTSPAVGAMVVGIRMSKKNLSELGEVIGSGAVLAIVVGDRIALQSGEDGVLPANGLAALVAQTHASRNWVRVGGDPRHYLVAKKLEGLASREGESASLAMFVRLSTEKEREAFLATIRNILLAGVGVVLVAALVAGRLARGISKPITDLVDGTKRIATGDYSVELPVLTRDELGTLTGAFNEMAKGLADRERYRTVLTKVVSKEVAHELMSQMRGQGLDFQGVSHACTILFSDIRGFTPLTEHMEPSEVISLLNEHMTAMVHVIERHRGVVNKFVGDEIIGVFGAPVQHGDDPLWAVRAGVEMVSEVKRMNVERAAKGKKEFAIGVGINTGNVVCGVMGSAERAEYTVLGAPVNLTARLCSAAKPMQVVITKFTLECVRDQVEALPLGEQSYKGFSEPIPVFEVRSARPSVAPQPTGTRS